MKSPIKTNQQQNFKYLYNTRRYLFWSGFLVLLTIGIIVFSLIPQINSGFRLYNDMLAANKKLAQLMVKASQLEQSSGSLVFASSELVNQALPSKKPLLELLTGLNVIGSRAQVQFSEISLTPGSIATQSAAAAPTRNTGRAAVGKSTATSANKRYDTLDIDLTATGQIANINSFLIEIEKLAPFTTVTAMTLNEKQVVGQTGSQPETEFEAMLTISTYFYPRAINANISAALPELSDDQRNAIEQLQGFTYTTLQQQEEIQGGGLENLFPGVEAIQLN